MITIVSGLKESLERDLVACDDPRLDVKRPPIAVTVPSLVYMTHRLGGPSNIDDGSTFLTTGRTGTTIHVRGTDIALAEVSRFKPDRPRPNGGLAISSWCPEDQSLMIIFNLPRAWHVDDWEVEAVMSDDNHSASDELDRLVAAYCDHRIGELLADTEAAANAW